MADCVNAARRATCMPREDSRAFRNPARGPCRAPADGPALAAILNSAVKAAASCSEDNRCRADTRTIDLALSTAGMFANSPYSATTQNATCKHP